jgi:hypothetical protein
LTVTSYQVVTEIERALQRDLPVLGGPPVPVRDVEMDGTRLPVVKAETTDRQGKTEGQPARTRAAQFGCVFPQTRGEEEGYAIRDPDSTTYTGAIESAEQFGTRIYREAWKRGWSRAQKKVGLGAGAEWIGNLAALHFFGAIPIVDLYPARQHLWELAWALYSNDQAPQKRGMMGQQSRLDHGRIEKLVRKSQQRRFPDSHRSGGYDYGFSERRIEP